MAVKLARLDIKLLGKIEKDLVAAPPSAAAKQAARQKAKAAIANARTKAAAHRSPANFRKVAKLKTTMTKAKSRLDQRWQPGSMRSPAQVTNAVLSRIDAGAKAPARTEETSLLIRADLSNEAAAASAVAKSMGLANAAALAAKGIRVRMVSPARRGKAPVYSIRLPLKISGMKTEVHNLAWALRKSGSFQSVRPDGGRRMIFAAASGHAERAERVIAWSHALTRTQLAHDLAPTATGRSLGEGIIIAHPDTGWAIHPNLNEARIDQQQSFNAGSETAGAAAAQTSSALADAEISNLNHGTATASIMIGARTADDGVSTIDEDDLLLATNLFGARDYGSKDNKVVDSRAELLGVSPRATLRSIKFIDDVQADIDQTGLNGVGVVRFADEDLVKAINHAHTSGAHVISLSVGGLMHSGVEDAIDLAVEEGDLIIVAAAGQTYTGETLSAIASAAAGAGVGEGDTVVLPAAYRNVIAVAGCTPDGRPWDESLRGPNVDITAPADAMWAADFKVENGKRSAVLECASGTSFAAAFMAGVAALWLGHWGRGELLRLYPDTPLAWVFRHQLQRTARSPHKDGWDTGLYGPGIVDVHALLREPLPNASDVPRPPATVENVFTVLSGTMDSPGADAVGDVWGLIWDTATFIVTEGEAFLEASWAAAGAAANAMLDLGERALTDLHTWADAQGQALGQAGRDAITHMTEFVDATAAAAEEALDAAAEGTEDAAEAVVDFVEESADTVGEAAEDVAEFLFGWI